MIDRFKDVLKESGHSYTVPRQTVFHKLLQSGPTTPTLLAQKCAPTIDRATAYRTIELFERLGVVNRIWHGFKSQIELSEIFTPHHHHASCQHCKASIDIVDAELERFLSRLAKQHHFLSLGHIVEITGYCQACQLKQ